MKIIPDFFRKVMARAKNDAGERIESLRFSVPALRVGVLEYGAGQLQTGNSELEGKPVKLYYPPEAVSDEKFLKSLETAPVVVGGHDSTTNEQNKKIDGWAHNVFFDKALNAAMIAGVVKGAKEVAYIKGNLGASGFGASAFVDIYNLKVENGVTPDGQEYNAIANDLRATHVALAPHVRDPENKIKVTNAVCVRNTGEMIENPRPTNSRYAGIFVSNTGEQLGLWHNGNEYYDANGHTYVEGSAQNGVYCSNGLISVVLVENAIDYKKVITNEVDRALNDAVKAAKADGVPVRLVIGSDINRAIDRFENSLSTEEYKLYDSDKAENEIEKRLKEIASREGVRVVNTKDDNKIILSEENMTPEEIAALAKNAVEEAIAAKNSEDRMGALEERVDKIGNALNEINEKLSSKKAEGENAAFEGKETPEEEAAEKKAEEGSPVENAKPSQEMVKAFATAYNVDFGGKTPSFATLAAFAGIKETDAVARLAAVNAKFNEIKGATAQNTEQKSASVSEVF